jgi:hypothetical protein
MLGAGCGWFCRHLSEQTNKYERHAPIKSSPYARLFLQHLGGLLWLQQAPLEQCFQWMLRAVVASPLLGAGVAAFLPDFVLSSFLNAQNAHVHCVF